MLLNPVNISLVQIIFTFADQIQWHLFSKRKPWAL